MAEISKPAETSRGKVRATKHSTKIDMTPMVDLAFLLLTFFILTTTFNDPRALELSMPHDDGTTSEITADNVLNLVVAENNRIYWWIGLEGKVSATNYSNSGLRKLLLERKKARPKTMILIKPKDNSKYENVIDVLDEIRITTTERYAIVDFTAADKEKLNEVGN
jgi:biopolymer transport protein ExbD